MYMSGIYSIYTSSIYGNILGNTYYRGKEVAASEETKEKERKKQAEFDTLPEWKKKLLMQKKS